MNLARRQECTPHIRLNFLRILYSTEAGMYGLRSPDFGIRILDFGVRTDSGETSMDRKQTHAHSLSQTKTTETHVSMVTVSIVTMNHTKFSVNKCKMGRGWLGAPGVRFAISRPPWVDPPSFPEPSPRRRVMRIRTRSTARARISFTILKNTAVFVGTERPNIARFN